MVIRHFSAPDAFDSFIQFSKKPKIVCILAVFLCKFVFDGDCRKWLEKVFQNWDSNKFISHPVVRQWVVIKSENDDDPSWFIANVSRTWLMQCLIVISFIVPWYCCTVYFYLFIHCQTIRNHNYLCLDWFDLDATEGCFIGPLRDIEGHSKSGYNLHWIQSIKTVFWERL